ncbi:hypothetical protein WME91_54250 [Sorangium sp. So ce269]
MNMFSKIILPLTFLGAAVVFGGCVVAAPTEGEEAEEYEGMDESESAPHEATPELQTTPGLTTQAVNNSSRWECFWGLVPVGTVDVWWGTSEADGVWACNNWIGVCGSLGGCWVQRR